MAGNKRKAATSASPEGTEPSFRTATCWTRPSVEIVEVSSDSSEHLYKSGPERGLDDKNVILPSTTPPSIEEADHRNDGYRTPSTIANRRMTRGLRHGRTDDRINYDLKYHPMDEVTRPELAAKRRSGSRSISAPGLEPDNGETSDDSMPSPTESSDREEGDEEASSDLEELPVRTPDPRAIRHSTRAEANKSVNYSRKHHPQDHALPGHQRKAKRLRRAEEKRKRASCKQSADASKSSTPETKDGQPVPAEPDEEAEHNLENELSPKQPIKPRKRLRMLPEKHFLSPHKSSAGKHTTRTDADDQIGDGPDTMLKSMSDAEMGEYLSNFGGSSGQQSSSDRSGAVQNLNGMIDEAKTSSSSAHELLDIAAAKLARPFAGVDVLASENEEDPLEPV